MSIMPKLIARFLRALLLLVCMTQAVQAQTAGAVSEAPAAAPAAAAAAPVPTAAIQPPAAQANPYGLQALWSQGDWVARITLLVLAIMSMGSWYVIITRLRAQARLQRDAQAAQLSFWTAETVRQGADTLHQDSAFRFIAESSLEATRKHEGLIGQVDLNTWVTQSIERAVTTVHNRTQEGLAVLATVGSTAPFVGLFGTVWGIYNALVKIGVSGQASIDRVAGPVGEALIMTALGLAVAVPAVLGYNWLVRRNKVAMDDVRAFGSDLHTVLLAANAKR